MNISFYPRIKETIPSRVIPIDLFLSDIQNGCWQDDVLRIRLIKDKELRQEAKRSVPYVTLSGEFAERSADKLLRHSGFLAIDIDDIEDVNDLKSVLCPDPHVYAAFVSISGNGLCVVFRINPDKHLDSFLGVQEYLFTTYNIVIDVLCKDVCRARYVSWDPDLYVNENAKKFTKYIKKEKAAPVKDIVYVQSDFDEIVRQIVDRKVDITGRYQQWLKVCFALCDKFGEAGRPYFHAISQFSELYSPKAADKQYNNCLKAGKSGITIKSFYFLAKEYGVITASAQTKKIATAAQQAKKGGRSKESVVKLLAEMDGVAPGDSEGIIDQVFDGSEGAEPDDLIQQFRTWISSEHSIWRNEITGRLEDQGKEMSDLEYNDIFSEARRQFPKLPKEAMIEVLGSNFIKTYHPIRTFFDRYKEAAIAGSIDELFGSIDSPTGWPGYPAYFGKKWIVGIVANVMRGNISPLLLVLCGEKMGTGKTRFFRDLLPAELQQYFTVKSLSSTNNESARRDLEIATSKYLLILDDEMSGKSKRDEKSIKALLRGDHSTHRAAFARTEERRIRLCGFAGTSNDLGVIGWDVGPQRHIAPIEVASIDFARLNAVSRISIWAEAYALYCGGFDYEVLGEDIGRLDQATNQFKQLNMEHEMVQRRFRKPIAGDMPEFFTTSDVKNALQASSREILSPSKIIKAFKDIGIEQVVAWINGATARGYWVVQETKIG